ncbi:MAG: hypothetical protein E7159_01215 [Firmicutes bacterium]|nr:hypothetical protein [Bacillota bacterium]
MNHTMKWVYDDGGASNYYKGPAYDCVTRAIAIATGRDYKEVLDIVNDYVRKEPLDERYVRNARNGVKKEITDKLLKDLGFKWVPTMKFGQGCKVHLRDDELPSGTIIVKLSKHICCIKDKIIHDTFNPTRDTGQGSKRCVYGYWIIKES